VGVTSGMVQGVEFKDEKKPTVGNWTKHKTTGALAKTAGTKTGSKLGKEKKKKNGVVRGLAGKRGFWGSCTKKNKTDRV